VRRLVAPVLLLAAWLALWGEISVVNVVTGVAAAVIVSSFYLRAPRGRHRIHPIGLVRLLAVFVWRLVTSSATVVRTVLAPTPARLRSGVIAIPLSDPSPLVAAIVADAISLTPGTLTLEVRYPGNDDRSRPPSLYVHVLGLAAVDELRDDVRGLERLVLSAITPDRTETATTTEEASA